MQSRPLIQQISYIKIEIFNYCVEILHGFCYTSSTDAAVRLKEVPFTGKFVFKIQDC